MHKLINIRIKEYTCEKLMNSQLDNNFLTLKIRRNVCNSFFPAPLLRCCFLLENHYVSLMENVFIHADMLQLTGVSKAQSGSHFIILSFHYNVRSTKENTGKKLMNAYERGTAIWPLFRAEAAVAMATCCALVPRAASNTRARTTVFCRHYLPLVVSDSTEILTGTDWVLRNKMMLHESGTSVSR